jgi:hypothetical protein
MDAVVALDAYLVYVWIRDIHPLLWRRVLIRADSTLADLHWVFQIAFSWTDVHLSFSKTHIGQSGEALLGCRSRKPISGNPAGTSWRLFVRI